MAKLSDTEVFKLRESYNALLKQTDGTLTAEGLHALYLECGHDFPLAKIRTLAKPMRILTKPSFLEAKMLFMQLKMFANKSPVSPRTEPAEAKARFLFLFLFFCRQKALRVEPVARPDLALDQFPFVPLFCTH